MKRFFVSVLFTITVLTVRASGVSEFIALADRFFKKHVSNGLVDYRNIKADNREIKVLYEVIGEMNLASATDAEKKAFYINAYNLIVIHHVAKHYPLKSPLGQSGFFDQLRHTVAGEQMTLNGLEIKKLLQAYKDGRIHFVLACAARSCPPLANFAYTPDKLDQQLNERTVATLNNPGWLKMHPTQKRIELSKIFDWYKHDFGTHDKNILAWINRFRKEPLPANYTIGYYEYDWSLNEK